MKMKLTLKHLAPYLPYGLKGKDHNGEDIEISIIMLSHWACERIGIRPILRPLSDLTKEIEIDGEKFVPLVKLAKMEFKGCSYFEDYKFDIADSYPLGGDNYIEFIDSDNDLIQLVYSKFMNSFVFFNITQKLKIISCLYNKEMVQKLLEWHFDIHGLIKEGLAIDTDTLES